METVVSLPGEYVRHMEVMLSTPKQILYSTHSALYKLDLTSIHPKPVLIAGTLSTRAYVEGKGEWDWEESEWEESYGSTVLVV